MSAWNQSSEERQSNRGSSNARRNQEAYRKMTLNELQSGLTAEQQREVQRDLRGTYYSKREER